MLPECFGRRPCFAVNHAEDSRPTVYESPSPPSFLVPCHRTYGRRADLARFGVRRIAESANRDTCHTSRTPPPPPPHSYASDLIIESEARVTLSLQVRGTALYEALIVAQTRDSSLRSRISTVRNYFIRASRTAHYSSRKTRVRSLPLRPYTKFVVVGPAFSPNAYLQLAGPSSFPRGNSERIKLISSLIQSRHEQILRRDDFR